MTTFNPAPVPVGNANVVIVPRSQIDRAPAPVPVTTDPGLTGSGTRPATPPVTPPVTEQPVPTVPTVPTVVEPNIPVTQPVYLKVDDEGTIVVDRTTVINFVGNGVSVVKTGGSTATVTITAIGSEYGNANVATFMASFGSNVISTSGNVTAAYFIGNGSQLTGLPATYGNANVAVFMADYGSNTISTAGNVTAGNILGGANINATTHTGTTVSVSANVTAGNITTAGLIVTTGNVSGGNIIAATLVQSATVSASGNVTGNYFIGNGSQLTGISTSFDLEMHVSKDGNDSTGTGTILRPYLTITHALTQVAGGRNTIVIHPGGYTENPTITSLATQLITYDATGASTLVYGTVTIANTTGRIAGLKMTNLAITGNAQAYINSSTVDEQFTKSSSGYVEVDDCELQVTGNVLISGSGTTTIIGNKINNLVVNNAGASVLIKGANDCLMPQVTAGSLNIVDSIIRASSNTANAVTASAGTVVTLMNNQIVTPASDSVARVSIAGFHSIISLVYDKANSTLSNSLNSVAYFQTANVDSLVSSGNITGGNILTGGLISATGNVLAGNLNLTGNIVDTGEIAILTGSNGNIRLIPNGTGQTNVTGLLSATGNIVGNFFVGNGSQLTGISGGTNTGNVTFNDQIVLGTGTNDGGGGLYLAPGNASIANSAVQYFRVRGGDVATHIHLDTGNNAYFDQYFGSDIKYVKLEAAGNIQIGSDDNTGNSAQWTFGIDGNLTLPLGSIVYETNIPDQSLSGSAIALKPIGGTTANQQLLIYPTAADGDHIHMTSGNLYATELFLGSDNLYVKLANTGNVVINSNDAVGNSAQWIFDASGDLTVPGNLVINGLTNVFGSNVALLQSNPDLPLLSVSSGSNGGVSSLWVEDIGNVGTSNIAAVYVNPTPGSGIVRIAVGQNGSPGPYLWDFSTTGNLSAPGNVSAVGNVTGGNILTAGLISVTGNITSANTLNAAGLSLSGNVVSALTSAANITTTANITGGNLSVTGNVIGTIGFTGASITINNAPGGNEGAEIQWALPSPANTVLSTSLVQDVFQNGMRFFESGGNSRGLYMDLGNVPDGAGTAVGYRDVPQISFTGNATLAATDAGRHYYSTLATANVLTIANNTSVLWSVGTAITVVNRGSGNITIAQGSGVSLYLAGNSTAGNRTVSTYGMATLLNVAANIWMINGTGVA